MADFQYIPTTQTKNKSQQNPSESTAEQLMNEQELDQEEHLHLPPPLFSRSDIPLDYAYALLL